MGRAGKGTPGRPIQLGEKFAVSHKRAGKPCLSEDWIDAGAHAQRVQVSEREKGLAPLQVRLHKHVVHAVVSPYR